MKSTVFTCNGCQAQEPAQQLPSGVQGLPVGWLGFNISIAHPRELLERHSGHACSVECMTKFVTEKVNP